MCFNEDWMYQFTLANKKYPIRRRYRQVSLYLLIVFSIVPPASCQYDCLGASEVILKDMG